MKQTEWYEYDEEGDVLDVYFAEKQRAWTIELTPNIMIAIDRDEKKVIRLTFLDYTELIRRTPWGARSFPITGLANLPLPERDLVLAALNSSPVERWLDISSVQNLPDSPFAVAHLEAPPSKVRSLVPLTA
ncbi:MAG: DUF2283 domain-containing protein [Chloroflexi bacterium]|nr:DUF2283 domain-containing protein [Chloroflexota bacterium]